MSGAQLFYYVMTTEEQQKWSALCGNIREKYASFKLSPMLQEQLEKRLEARGVGSAKGYSEEYGYFHVDDGDRGRYPVIFRTASYEEAEHQMLKELAHDLSYQHVLKEKKQIEREHRGEWRFYTVEDGREAGRILSHTEENTEWKFDAKYDYRKYWFEGALCYLKHTVSQKVFLEEVQRYEELLNHWFEQPFWKFDLGCMEFVTA
ncbi:MAG: hypothetical protein J6A77_09860 [Lachnospiraceae bacterium]|nr:hypothetical protein [Lachnospiraceae bacterium]